MMKNGFKCVVPAVALSAALILLPFTSASSAEVKSSNDKASVSLYGQVNRAFFRVNDGKESQSFSVDNDSSSTRMGVKAKAKKGDFTVGGKIEIEYESDSSAKVAMDDSQQADRTNQRKLNVYLEHKKMGKLTFGQESTASDGTSETDLSGTGVASCALPYSFEFYDVTAKAYSGVEVEDVINNLDGASRKDIIRYDTSEFSGFQLSTSAYNNDGQNDHDFAIRYSVKIGETEIEGAASYLDFDGENATKKNQMSGSLSILLPMGLNFTVASGSLEHKAVGREDGAFRYAKIGYKSKLSDIGTTAFSVDYGKFDDMAQNKDEAKYYSFSVVQKLSDWSTELYLNMNKISLDRPGTNYDDIQTALIGVRIKF